MFDQSAFTITSQAAGGSGSWRLWHYAAQDEDTLEDMLKPGFFSSMSDHIHTNDFVTVTAPKFAAILVLAFADGDVKALEMSSVEMPDDAAVTPVQGLPAGTEPGTHKVESVTDLKAADETDKPAEDAT